MKYKAELRALLCRSKGRPDVTIRPIFHEIGLTTALSGRRADFDVATVRIRVIIIFAVTERASERTYVRIAYCCRVFTIRRATRLRKFRAEMISRACALSTRRSRALYYYCYSVPVDSKSRAFPHRKGCSARRVQ